MVGVVAGGTQGGWAYMRLQTEAVFQGPTHSRSLTVSLTLLAMLFVGVAVLGTARSCSAAAPRSVFAIVHPQDRAAVQERLVDLRRRRGRTTRLQCRVIHENGGFRWFDLTATNQLHNPALSGIVVNARDISDSREFQEKLASVGVHLAGPTEQPEDVIKAADEAMYAVKRAAGRR